MHKAKTQRSGELFVNNMLIFYFYMVIIKTYKVKNSFKNFRKDLNKFLEISRGKFNFQTHNPTRDAGFLLY